MPGVLVGGLLLGVGVFLVVCFVVWLCVWVCVVLGVFGWPGRRGSRPSTVACAWMGGWLTAAFLASAWLAGLWLASGCLGLSGSVCLLSLIHM